MKEKTITKYECEFCHKVYDRKESAISCEESHKGIEIIPIKKISFDKECVPQIRVEFYPNAQYNKKNDCIRLHTNNNYNGSDFKREYWYSFDEIQEDELNTMIIIYTTNLDPKYEEECIKKIIDFKINKLNEEIENMKKANNWENIAHYEYK